MGHGNSQEGANDYIGGVVDQVVEAGKGNESCQDQAKGPQALVLKEDGGGSCKGGAGVAGEEGKVGGVFN